MQAAADDLAYGMSYADWQQEMARLVGPNAKLQEIAYAEAEIYSDRIEEAQSQDASRDYGQSAGDNPSEGSAGSRSRENQKVASQAPAVAAAPPDAPRPSLDLAGQSEGEIRADDVKLKRDAADKAAQANAPRPEDFKMTGSDRADDVGTAAGQNKIF